MFRIMMVMTALALAGCAESGSSSTVMKDLNQQYAGHKAQDFFLSYGRPVNEKNSEDGGKVYRWASLEQGQAPLAPVFQSAASPAGRIPLVEAIPAGGQGIEQYCELKIEADSHDRIRHLSIVYDSPGKYTNSRCMELFR